MEMIRCILIFLLLAFITTLGLDMLYSKKESPYFSGSSCKPLGDGEYFCKYYLGGDEYCALKGIKYAFKVGCKSYDNLKKVENK